jgi:FMN-dependent NADH-azoreductase
MNTLLIVNSSPRSQSVSRRLTQHFVDEWKKRNPDTQTIERDLSSAAIPLVNEPWIQAVYTPEAQRTPEQQKMLQLSDALIAELMMADTIVLGVPMHNFTVPTVLKAWIDQIARAGKTFAYNDQGPKGLIPSEKKVFAIVSRGGPYAPDSPVGAMDFQVPYLQKMLAFLGLTDVTFIHADKQGFGPEAAQQAIDRAVQHLSQIAEGCATHLANAA